MSGPREQQPIIWGGREGDHEVTLYVDERGRTRLLVSEDGGEYVEFWDARGAEAVVRVLIGALFAWREYDEKAMDARTEDAGTREHDT
jgi:hypothetical protein